MSKYPYLYRNSFAEALRCGELGKWRSSHQENITCRKDIEAAVSAGFDGGRLAEGCAQDILYRHGFKRVQHVLANTIRGRAAPGRSTRSRCNGAVRSASPTTENTASEFVVRSPPAALNLFADQVYQAYQALGCSARNTA